MGLLFCDDYSHSDTERLSMLKHIQAWAEAHLELKIDNTIVDGVYESHCRFHLEIEQKALDKLILQIQHEPKIEVKEKLLISWFEMTFVPSEKRCKGCEYNK